VEFRNRLREAFATLEVAVANGHIGAYGIATWNGFRVPPHSPEYLSLAMVLGVARDVAGSVHHLRAVQLPVNFQMLEALSRSNQSGANGLVPLLEVAAEQGVTVIASASLLQGRVIGRLPSKLQSRFDANLTDAQRGLQFVRSAPGLTAALAGMSRPEHVEENMQLDRVIPMTVEAFRGVFS
jgi:aryl-alcohol dehydrogenase-like predicted oxidoreductase